MFAVPKFGVYNEMQRMNKGKGVAKKPLRGYGTALVTPAIGPDLRDVHPELGVIRAELGEKIQRQRANAERAIEERRLYQLDELSKPATVMEEYFAEALKKIRRKEQDEAERAYLSEEQKNELMRDALARKANINGDFVRYADEMVARDREIDDMLQQSYTDTPIGSLERQAVPYIGDLQLLMREIPPGKGKQYITENHSKLFNIAKRGLKILESIGHHSRTITKTVLQNVADALRKKDVPKIRKLLNNLYAKIIPLRSPVAPVPFVGGARGSEGLGSVRAASSEHSDPSARIIRGKRGKPRRKEKKS